MANAGGKFLIGNIGRTGTATGPHIHTTARNLETGALMDPDTIKTPFLGVEIGEKRIPLVRRNAAGGLEWNPEAGLTITSRFGKRDAPTAGASTYHQGIDFAGAAGTPVFYRGYGKALPVPSAGGYGNLMTFRTGDNKYELGFGHMSKLGPEAQVYASNLNSKPAVPSIEQRQQEQLIGAGTALALISKLFGQAKNDKDSSRGLYSSLVGSMLNPKQDTTTDFLMNYMMQNPYEA